ncbi:hypothetical protein FUAX_26790 [Fulvitalea axinellae]|uniref:Peptidase M56 domain-containing protein n=1 Tax=Fulvitalea axinellae TaxID=1182444 RepID=A0AAU9CT99_9BACT|nr:hypothetical protein FUAX_26790 [Fulvitalea axinellae]
MLSFVIENIIATGLFFLFYRKVLAKEHAFRLNRYYLLVALGLSAVLPLFPWSNFLDFAPSENLKPLIVLLAENGIPQIGEGADAVSEGRSFGLSTFFVGLYGVTLLFLLVRLSGRVWMIFDLIKRYRHDVTNHGNFRVVTLNGDASTFSFLNFMFWNPKEGLDTESEKRIWNHELAHIKQRHSLDVLFVEFMCVIFWFNPFLWFFRKDIMANHEFLADSEVLKDNDWSDYADLLVRQLFNNMDYDLGNFFNKSMTLRRVRMMKDVVPIKRWKYWIVVPFILLSMVTVGCVQEMVVNDYDGKYFRDLKGEKLIVREYPIKTYKSEVVINSLKKEGLVIQRMNVDNKKGVVRLTLKKGEWLDGNLIKIDSNARRSFSEEEIIKAAQSVGANKIEKITSPQDSGQKRLEVLLKDGTKKTFRR